MKSQRMTDKLRWKIRNHAEELKFKDQNNKLMEEKYNLSEEIYNAYYWKYLPIMEQLPDNAFKKKNYIYLRNSNEDRTIILELRFKKDKKIFNSIDIYDDPSIIPFRSKIEKLKIKEELLNKMEKEYLNKLYTFLENIKTTKQLIELMPEAETWLTENSNECSDIPLADIVAELRSL